MRFVSSEFNKLLTRYLENERTQHAGHFNARDELRGGHRKTVTVFVPSDDAIANIPQQQLTQLKADSTQLKKVGVTRNVYRAKVGRYRCYMHCLPS